MTNGEKKDERPGAEEKYKALVETAADAIITLDLLGRLTFVNPAGERISGYSEEELVGKHFRELLPAKHIPACLNVFQKALRGQPTPPLEIEMITKQGQRVPLELLGRPVKRGRRVVQIIGIARDITERKQAEEALRETHESYKELADSIIDVFFAMDKDLRYTYWNKASEELTGISAKDAIGKSLYDLFPDTPQTRKAAKVYLDVLRTQQPQTFINEYQLEGKDFVFEISAYPSRDGLSVFVKDITQRKRAEEALLENEERYRNVVERANDGIVIIQDTIIRYANPRLAEMWGGTVQEFIDTPFTDYVHPDELPKLVDRYKRRMAGQNVTPIYETALGRKDGSKLYAELNAGIITYQGKPADLVIVRDITERRQAEEALRESEEKYRSILENIEDGYYEVDLAGNLTFFNDSLCGIIGYSRDEMMGMNNRQYLDKENAKKVFQAFNQVYTTGKPTKGFDWEIIRKDGTRRFVEASASLIRNLEGEPAGFRGIVRDITERKRAEKEIRRRSQELAALRCLPRRGRPTRFGYPLEDHPP